jgi:hypothetical protein
MEMVLPEPVQQASGPLAQVQPAWELVPAESPVLALQARELALLPAPLVWEALAQVLVPVLPVWQQVAGPQPLAFRPAQLLSPQPWAA